MEKRDHQEEKRRRVEVLQLRVQEERLQKEGEGREKEELDLEVVSNESLLEVFRAICQVLVNKADTALKSINALLY